MDDRKDGLQGQNLKDTSRDNKTVMNISNAIRCKLVVCTYTIQTAKNGSFMCTGKINLYIMTFIDVNLCLNGYGPCSLDERGNQQTHFLL